MKWCNRNPKRIWFVNSNQILPSSMQCERYFRPLRERNQVSGDKLKATSISSLLLHPTKEHRVFQDLSSLYLVRTEWRNGGADVSPVLPLFLPLHQAGFLTCDLFCTWWKGWFHSVQYACHHESKCFKFEWYDSCLEVVKLFAVCCLYLLVLRIARNILVEYWQNQTLARNYVFAFRCDVGLQSLGLPLVTLTLQLLILSISVTRWTILVVLWQIMEMHLNRCCTKEFTDS